MVLRVHYQTKQEEKETVGRRIDDIRTRLAGLERELAVLERWPSDDFADGSVLTFTKTFNLHQLPDLPEERNFNYAAIKAVGVWYLTSGGSTKTGQELRGGVTYDRMIQFIGDAKVWIMKRDVTVEQAARMHELHLAAHDAEEAQARFDAAPEVGARIDKFLEKPFITGVPLERPIKADVPAGMIMREASHLPRNVDLPNDES